VVSARNIFEIAYFDTVLGISFETDSEKTGPMFSKRCRKERKVLIKIAGAYRLACPSKFVMCKNSRGQDKVANSYRKPSINFCILIASSSQPSLNDGRYPLKPTPCRTPSRRALGLLQKGHGPALPLEDDGRNTQCDGAWRCPLVIVHGQAIVGSSVRFSLGDWQRVSK
jgi:hypothetical protein